MVAVKVESRRTVHPQLDYESRVYTLVKSARGFPRVYFFGKEDRYNVMVMQLCGPSLEELFVRCKRRLGLRTVLALAEMMLRRVETLHARGYTHRDIKPENFLMGVGEDSHTLFMIDLGLSKKYYDRVTRRHIAFRDDKKLTGTARYVSVNTHAGCEQSRRDDLEALGHVFLYLLQGSLPWQGQGGDTKEEKYSRIHALKRDVDLEKLCKGIPKEFLSYMRYCRSLSFEEVPNYSSLRKMFRDLWELKGYSHEDPFDWELPEAIRGDSEGSINSEDPKAEHATSKDDTENADVVSPAPTTSAAIVDPRIAVASNFVRKK